MKETLNKHKNIVLQFSGGKDSLATLFVCEPWWDKITVVWVNTGAAMQETKDVWEKVKKLVPHVFELITNQPNQVAEMGYPVDVLPLLSHPIFNKDSVRVQPFYDCCSANMWMPMQALMQHMKPTLIIRGQKNVDKMKGPVRSGKVIDGVEYLHPIEDWTDERVFEYLKMTPIGVPPHYEFMGTSLDCWSCTAYLQENKGKLTYLKKFEPGMYEEVRRRLIRVREALRLHDHTDEILKE